MRIHRFVNQIAMWIFLLCLSVSPSFLFAQWLNLNPGAGGQVQGVSCNQEIPGVMYMNSDMEGNYISKDYGQSWKYIGYNLTHKMTFFTLADPKDSKRLYCGSHYGLSISDDEGEIWRLVDGPMKGMSTATMAIDPQNSANLYVGNSWYIKNPATNKTPSESATGSRIIWISKDRGKSWESIIYDSASGLKQCYTITINPTNSGEIYLGAASGFYRSTNGGYHFEKISPPAGFTSCRGGDITPDGYFAYAVFSKDETPNPTQTSVFYARTKASNNWIWEEIASLITNNGLFYANGKNTYYWKPVIDPRSTSTKHRVLIGCMISTSIDGQGLYEFVGNVENENVSGKWNMVFAQSGYAGFVNDGGWNNLIPQVRHYGYTPAKWPERKVLVASQQSLYYGNPELPNNDQNKWECLSSRKSGQAGQYNMYSTRGIQSTVTFDASAWKNYMVQSQADNRIIESWDYGKSWTQQSRPNGKGESGDFVDVIPANNGRKALVITASGGPYGGVRDTGDGSFWGKFLSETPSPTDSWQSLENGESGLPVRRSRAYHASWNPNDYKNVIMVLDTGLYETNDIYDRMQGTGGRFRPIGPTGNWWYGKVWFDPDNGNSMFAHENNGIYKATRKSADDEWLFEKIFTGNVNSCTFWKYKGAVYIAYSAGDEIFLSSDGGMQFAKVADRDAIMAIKKPYWFGNWKNGAPMAIGIRGLAGNENAMYFGTRTNGGNASLGIFKGVISPGFQVSWEDWSGHRNLGQEIEYGGVWEGKILTLTDTKGSSKTWYLASTWGCGLWIREISDTTTASWSLFDQKDNSIKIYPSPVKEWLNVCISDYSDIPCRIQLFSLQGQLMNEYILERNNCQLNLSDLPDAPYIVRMNQQSKSSSALIIKSGGI